MSLVRPLGRRAFVATLAAALGPRGVAARQTQGPARRVLFIGNSLTSANDLPGMIEALANDAAPGSLATRTVAFADFSLEDHWTDGRARRAIRDAAWSHVVLQQGPSSLPASQTLLREYAQRFAKDAKARGASVVLFSVWPPRARAAFFDAVTDAYRRAADAAGGIAIPVGEAMRAALRRDAALPLFEADGFHPSPLGSYLAARLFCDRLTGREATPARRLDAFTHAALRRVRATPEQLRLVQDAIAEVR